MVDGAGPVRARRPRHSLRHHDAPAQRDGRPPHGPRAQQHHPGRPRPVRAHAGQGGALAPGHRPRRHRHPERGRAPARQGRHHPLRHRPGGVRRAGLGPRARDRRHHPRAAQGHRLLRRLVPHLLHPGRGPLARGARGLRPAVRQGPGLPRATTSSTGAPAASPRSRTRRRRRRRPTGKLWHFRYPLADGSGHVTVATTRPETMLGDTGRGRAPGRRALPGARGPADPAPGGGPADPDRGRRRGGPRLRHRRGEGDAGPRPHRLRDREAPRAAQYRRDDAGGADEPRGAGAVPGARPLRGAEAGGGGIRGRGAPGEGGAPPPRGGPLLPLRHGGGAAALRAVVREDGAAGRARPRRRTGRGGCRFVPERRGEDYAQWMENIRDWCISRQLWWGHRIPVWYCEYDHCARVRGQPHRRHPLPRLRRRRAPGRGRARHLVLLLAGALLQPGLARRRPPTSARFYPGDTLVTAPEILFFWVARMVMAGCEFMGEVPFETVYLHGTVRDTPASQDVQVAGQRDRPARRRSSSSARTRSATRSWPGARSAPT